ncbi:RNA-binding ATPase activator esf2 [Podila epigama]|nr:RNA-binding ATPase activator esf2 [Podila epigama]
MKAKTKTEDFFKTSGAESDDHSSDSDAGGYDSDEQEAQARKRKAGAAKKNSDKKKNTVVFGLDDQGNSSDDQDDEDDYSSQDEDKDDKESVPVSSDPRFQLDQTLKTESKSDEGNKEEQKQRVRSKKKNLKTLTPEALEEFQKAREKTGIVYLSKIPPFMKPVKLRQLLSPYGEVGKIYLAPEDPKIAARRKKYGGNKKQNFTEGWVEFKDKTIAKQVAKSLNTTTIGGKKKGHYHDDIWNIKYLPKFKWHHLTERIAYENASRAQRMQAEINQAKRENKFILGNIEKSKMIKSMEEKKEAKRKAETESSEGTKKKAKVSDTSKSSSSLSSASASASASTEGNMKGIRRAFKQRKLEMETGKPVEGKIKSVLGSVFGR